MTPMLTGIILCRECNAFNTCNVYTGYSSLQGICLWAPQIYFTTSQEYADSENAIYYYNHLLSS